MLSTMSFMCTNWCVIAFAEWLMTFYIHHYSDSQLSLSDTEPSVVVVVNLFSKWIGSLSFHPTFPHVHNNIAHKLAELEFWIFASNFKWIFNYKSTSKLRFLAIFFQKNFDTGRWNLVYRQIVATFRCLWKMVKMGQNLFSNIFVTIFHWILVRLDF